MSKVMVKMRGKIYLKDTPGTLREWKKYDPYHGQKSYLGWVSMSQGGRNCSVLSCHGAFSRKDSIP